MQEGERKPSGGIALITGASSGIGEALAKEFAVHGFDLILVARSELRLRETAAQLGHTYGRAVEVIPEDLSGRDAPEELFRRVSAHHPSIEVLVNNAGFGDFGPFHTSDWDKNRRMIDVNIVALTALTRLFLPGMVARRSGRILNIASTAAFQPGPLMSVYYASKAYVLHFSEAIANELEGTGVTVTAYCPGPVRTGFQEAAAAGDNPLAKGRRLPSPDEVALDAFRALMAGKVVQVPGVMNYLLSLAPRMVSRSMVRKVSRYIQDQRR